MDELEKLFRKKLRADGWRIVGPSRTYDDVIQLTVIGHEEVVSIALLHKRTEEKDFVHNEIAWNISLRENGGISLEAESNRVVLNVEPFLVLLQTLEAFGQLRGREWVIFSPRADYRLTDPSFDGAHGLILLSLAGAVVQIMSLKIRDMLPLDMGGNRKYCGSQAVRDEYLRRLDSHIVHDDAGRLKGLLHMVAHVFTLGLVRPAHGGFVLDSIHVTWDDDNCILYLAGGMDARVEEIIFWDVATMYFDIYAKWGKADAHTFRNYVRGKLDVGTADLFNQYFADVCALHYLMLYAFGDGPLLLSYVDELLEL